MTAVKLPIAPFGYNAAMSSIGKSIRLGRVLEPATDRALIVACSHGILMGPCAGLETTEEFNEHVSIFAEGGATGLIVTPGYLRLCANRLVGAGRPAVVLSLSWTNIWRGPELLGHANFLHAHTTIATIEDAVRAGADMAHVYMHIGSKDPKEDAAELKLFGEVVAAAERFGMPVLCEPLARGTAVPPGQTNRPEYVALVARIAAEAGADIVKVEYTGDPDSFSKVVQGCGAPVVMMGGAKSDRFIDFLTTLEDALTAGAKGVAVGRNLFLHEQPALAMKAVRSVVIDGESAEAAAEELERAVSRKDLQNV